MRVAVVIPVRDEAGTIGPLLDDLAAQQPPADEVVVVDAGSRDGTGALLERRARAWPALRVVTLPPSPPGRARNAGVAACRADLVATVDAGSRVGPGWVAALRDAALSGPRAVAVGMAEADARSDFERAAGWFTVRGFKPPDGPGPVGREFLPAGRNGLCLRRAAWEAAGGWSEDVAFSEDKLFLRRLRTTGAEVLVAPEAVVRWRPRGSLGAMYRQYRNYGYGDGRSGIDRQNELVPLGLLALGSALAARRPTRPAAASLAAAYLGLFAAAAVRGGLGRAAAWVPLIRLVVDVAKVHGFLEGAAARMRQRGS